jgi:hypothetical protein
MNFRIATVAFALFAALAAPSHASVIGLQVERTGGLKVHQLDNGNFLGLWRFNNREGINPGAGAVTIGSADDILGGFIFGRDRIVGFYNGATPVNAGASEFDPLVYSFTIADNARLLNSLWIEWTGGRITYQQPNGKRASMNSRRVTLPGDPLAVAVVPAPAALPLLLAGLGALAFARRRRAA